MGHLSRERLLALAESADPPRDPHLEMCLRCREAVGRLRDALADLRAVDIPEPAPLFWQHLSDRIRLALPDMPAGPRRADAWRPWLAWAAPLSAAVGLALGALVLEPRQRAPVLDEGQGFGVDAVSQTDDDEWRWLLAVLAEDEGAVAESLAPPAPGDTEPLVTSLSSAEQDALVLLLERELERARP